jgi:methyl-accepting chemotaxis protein
MSDEQEKEEARKDGLPGGEVLLKQQTVDFLVANVFPTTKYFETHFAFLQHEINQLGEGQKRLEDAMDRRFEQTHDDIKELKSDVDRRFDQTRTEIKEFKSDVDKRFEQVDKRFEQVDKRFEQVDKRFEQVDKRFEQIIASLDRMSDKLDRRDVEQRHFTIRMFTVAISISFLGVLGVLLKMVGVF